MAFFADLLTHFLRLLAARSKHLAARFSTIKARKNNQNRPTKNSSRTKIKSN